MRRVQLFQRINNADAITEDINTWLAEHGNITILNITMQVTGRVDARMVVMIDYVIPVEPGDLNLFNLRQ